MSSPEVSSFGEWLAPPFKLRTNSIPVGTPAPASTIASCPAPETSLGASGSRVQSVSNGAASLAGDRRDHSERLVRPFEHGPLLDVQLDERVRQLGERLAPHRAGLLRPEHDHG